MTRKASSFPCWLSRPCPDIVLPVLAEESAGKELHQGCRRDDDFMIKKRVRSHRVSHRQFEGDPVVHPLEQRSGLLVHENPRQGYEEDNDEDFGEDKDEDRGFWGERDGAFCFCKVWVVKVIVCEW